MLGYAPEYEVSEGQLSSFESQLESNATELPDARLVRHAESGVTYRAFRLVVGEEAKYFVTPRPVESSHVVNPNEPEEVETGFYVRENDRGDDETGRGWLIQPDDVDEFEVLPKVLQAFHEGEAYFDREADYKYHFPDGTTQIAVRASDPVSRLEEPVTITNLTLTNPIGVPFEWIGVTEDNEKVYLRERSGAIRADWKSGENEGKTFFKAYVGGEHPGTRLTKEEVLQIISAVDYINFADEPSELPDVPEEHEEEFWDYDNDVDYEELYEEMEDDLFIEDNEEDGE